MLLLTHSEKVLSWHVETQESGNVDAEKCTHLAKVSDIKEVKRVKQLTVPQAKFVMAYLEECPDVLQTQEL